MNKSNSNSSGLGMSGVLTIIFIVLKLVGVIDWSWWWVLSPIWIDLVVALILIGVVVLVGKSSDNKHDRSDRIKW